jgi:hypothetical protein
MWEKIEEHIYYINNAISEENLNYFLDKMRYGDFYEIKSEGRKHYINETFFDYKQSDYKIHEDHQGLVVIKNLVDKCFLYTNQELDLTTLTSSFKISAKFFDKNSSYGLHFEDPTYFGNYFLVLYLDNCNGGELVFPTREGIDVLFAEAKEDKNEWNKGVIHLKKNNYEPLFLENELKIKPKKNTAILAKIPLVHYVNPIIDQSNILKRPVINGFIL